VDNKELISKVSNSRISSMVENLRPAKPEEEPPTGPAMGTLSPTLTAQVRNFKGGR
jgi:hypothetical protein